MFRPPLPVTGFCSSSSIHPTLSAKFISSTRRLSSKYRERAACGRELHVSRLSTLVRTCSAACASQGLKGRQSLSPSPPLVVTMATLNARRPHTTSSKGKEPERRDHEEHDHDNDHDHGRGHSHTHSHSVFSSLGHAHTHGENGHGDAETVVKVLQGAGMFCPSCQ